MTPTNKAESMGEVEEEMGSSRDLSHTSEAGQGNPTLADIDAARVRRGDLIHYGDEPLGALMPAEQEEEVYSHGKPNGLWVSVLGPSDWASWCRSESFRNTRQQAASRIVLGAGARILRMSTSFELDGFTYQYGEGDGWRRGINWLRVAADYDGIIIAPYVWSRRLHDRTNWYYGWDCASGCIWQPRAIERVESLRDGVGRAPRPPVIDGASSRDEPPSPPTGRALLKDTPNG